MKKVMKWTGIVLGGLIGLSLLAGVVLYPIGMKKLSGSYPDIEVETVSIPTDPDAVVHGRHISIIWGCIKCHGEDLGGMLLANDPFLGTIPAPNLSSGSGGIGTAYTDTDWIRAIRHGVKPDGQGLVFMYNYSTLSDQDLGDLIVYLKQVQPVDSDFPAMRIGPLDPMAYGAGVFALSAEVIAHDAPRPADPAPGATIEYGRYLWAICRECHSSSLAGELDGWMLDNFARAVRTGLLPNGRHLPAAMSTKTFGELNDTELGALWLYIMDAGR